MKAKQILFTLVLASGLGMAFTTEPEPVKISGSVIFFGVPYENANHLESRPLVGEKYYVREFNKQKNYIGPILDSLVSDSAGEFTLYLLPGHYSFISEENAAKIGLDKHFNPSNCDSICFVKQLQAGDATFQVDPNDNVKLTIYGKGSI